MTGAKISTKGIWGMRVDSNPPISVSRPLAVQNHNPAPDRDVCLVTIRWLVDLNRRAYLKCLWLRIFLRFHFISTVHIWFISSISNTHFFHGNIWTHNWPAPHVSGFTAQLVEHRTGNREVTGSNPVEVLNFFFRASSLRRSFLHFHFISAVRIWLIPYIINIIILYTWSEAFLNNGSEHRRPRRSMCHWMNILIFTWTN